MYRVDCQRRCSFFGQAAGMLHSRSRWRIGPVDRLPCPTIVASHPVAAPADGQHASALVPRLISLDDVLITGELSRRTPRPADYRAESQALHVLARQLAEQPQAMFKHLAAVALDLCGAGTAGLSLL